MEYSGISVVKNMFWRYAERFLAQIVSFVVSLVLARILVPEDYGTVSLILVIINILEVFSTRGFNQALIQKPEIDELDYNSALWTNIFINGALYFLLVLTAPFIAKFYDNQEMIPMLMVLGLKIVVGGYSAIQQAYVQRNMQFKKFFGATLIGTIISAILGIVMAFQGFGPWALIGQSLSNTVIDTIVLVFIISWRGKFQYSFSRTKKMLGFGTRLLMVGLLEAIYNQLRSLVVGKVYSASDLAYYNKGQELPSVVVMNVQVSVNNVLFSALSRVTDMKRKKELIRSYYRVMLYILFPLLVGMAAVSKPMVCVLYTDKWLGAVPYVIVYCFSYLMWVPQLPILNGLNSSGRADCTLRITIIHRVVGVCLLLAMLKKGPMYIALSALIADIVITIVTWMYGRKEFGYGIREIVEDSADTTFLVLGMLFSICIVNIFVKSNQGQLLCDIILGGAVYIALSVVTRNRNLYVLINGIKKMTTERKRK